MQEIIYRSLPSRERGLKSVTSNYTTEAHLVAPLAGAWIEIARKFLQSFTSAVAPLAGAWIEIIAANTLKRCALRRSPRGSVD